MKRRQVLTIAYFLLTLIPVLSFVYYSALTGSSPSELFFKYQRYAFVLVLVWTALSAVILIFYGIIPFMQGTGDYGTGSGAELVTSRVMASLEAPFTCSWDVIPIRANCA